MTESDSTRPISVGPCGPHHRSAVNLPLNPTTLTGMLFMTTVKVPGATHGSKFF